MDKKHSIEKRRCKISVRNCSGNAGKNAKQYSIGLPTRWMQSMNITPDDRDVEIAFDGTQITLQKRQENGLEEA